MEDHFPENSISIGSCPTNRISEQMGVIFELPFPIRFHQPLQYIDIFFEKMLSLSPKSNWEILLALRKYLTLLDFIKDGATIL